MIRLLKKRFLCVSLLLGILYSCADRSTSRSGEWNEQNSIFTIADNLSYSLPTDISLWAIADKDVLPSNMLFFGIDKSEDICVGIFRPAAEGFQTKRVVDYSEDDVDSAVRQLSNPDQNQTVIYENIDKRNTYIDGAYAWHYILEHKIVNKLGPDTIPIFYSGYIFDGHESPFGLVIISNLNPKDSIGQIQFAKYASALHIEVE